MKKLSKYLRDTAITIVLLLLAFAVSLLCQKLDVEEHTTTVFVFAIFLISLITNGYIYGVLAAVVGTLAVNYAFTFPYFVLNFTIPVNVISAVVLIVIAFLTSALTTKLKQHEAMKAESEKESMRANLLRAISHDLRTPLTTIYSSGTTLMDKGSEMSEAQKSKIIQGIVEDSQWLTRMVENLLSVTRIDDGQVKIIKMPVVLEELIDTVVLKFKKRYPNQKVEIEIPEDMVIIPMDAILMEQVLVNILENAVQHAEGMTKLSLRVFTLGDQAIFEIKDDGCGIDPKRLDTIFTGCYTAKNEIADSQKRNAGIGLSVCATIVKAHGGTIKAENPPKGGALFRFALNTEEVCDD